LTVPIVMARRPSAHARIRDELRREIQNGTLRAGDLLPTEYELVERHGVSRHTVRVALQQLASEGLITRRAGYGTWVTPYANDPASAHIVGDDRHIFGLTAGPPLQLVEPFALVRDSHVARTLDARSDEVARLAFTRSSHGHTIGYWLIWLPPELFEQVTPSVPALQGGSESVINIVERTTRQVAQRAEQDMTAEAADEEVAGMLGVEVGAPLLRAERTYFNADERPLEHVVVRYVPDHFRYRLHFLRNRAAGDGGDR
jgi:DNA-binding GntR family transcriptional regulator